MADILAALCAGIGLVAGLTIVLRQVLSISARIDVQSEPRDITADCAEWQPRTKRAVNLSDNIDHANTGTMTRGHIVFGKLMAEVRHLPRQKPMGEE